MSAEAMTGWVVAWAATAVVIATVRTVRRAGGVGLVTAFLVNFGIAYWLGAAIALLPWYTSPDLDTLAAGFRQSTFALGGFAVGAVLLAPRPVDPRAVRSPGAGGRGHMERLPRIYACIGLTCLLVLLPAARQIPTASALVSQGWNLLIAGLALGCWSAWAGMRPVSFGWWLLGTLCLPLLTILTQGFLGYGSVAAVAVLCFIASFYRPRWRVFLAAFVLAQVGLSLYVTYMRDRNAIRDVVWGGGSVSERAGRVYETISTLEWFDLHNQDHLARISQRLDQNAQVGAAVEYLDAGLAQFAYGQTLIDGAISLVPRAIWPSKPLAAGGASLVTRYTGIVFDPTTSVGIGNVMEAYVSFGTIGVTVWFVLLGAVLARVDAAAARHLRRGDWPRFVQWFLPGMSLLAVNASIVELTSSVAAASVVALIVKAFVSRSVAPQPPAPSIDQRLPIKSDLERPRQALVSARFR